MRQSASFVAVLLGALALASTAGAVDGARLVVSTSSTSLGKSSTVGVELESDGAVEVALLVPRGYPVDLGQAPGTRLGPAAAGLSSEGEANGLVEVADDAAAAACADPDGHDAVWRLALGELGIPIVVDRVTDEPESEVAAYRLELCLPVDTELRSLDLELEGVFTNPAGKGAYTWRALLARAASPAVEARSTVLLPVRLSLRGRYKAGRAVLSGGLEGGGEPVRGERVRLWTGKSPSARLRSGKVRTDDSGAYKAGKRVSSTSYFRATADVPVRNVGADGCGDPIAPGGCVSATRAAFGVATASVKVAVPLPTLRLGSRGVAVRELQRRLVQLRYLPGGAANGAFDWRTWHGVVALQGWMGLPRDGVVGRSTWKALARARTPSAGEGLVRGVLIDRWRQVMLLVSGGRTVRAIHVSTGAPGHTTPGGRFSVYRKETLSWSVPFQVWMPYANYFLGGYAMHGYSSVPAYPASHGCVRIPLTDAPFVYGFATYGMPVRVR